MSENGRSATAWLCVVIAAAMPVLSGCFGPPPAPQQAPSTAEEPADPLATTFQVQQGLGVATEADTFADVNPFGYQNPLR